MTGHETLDIARKRLIFRSWHRGTREMDLLMGSFADRNVPEFTAEQCAQYEDILNYSDPDVYDWYIGRTPAPANLVTPVLEMLMRHRFREGS